MKKPMLPSTRAKIRHLYTKEGYGIGELLIMFWDYGWRDIRKAVKGLKRAKQR